MREILRAENITKNFPDKDVLKDITLTLKEGELICLLGVSGVGKTTLFNVLSGLTMPDSGRVLLAKDEDEKVTKSEGSSEEDEYEDITGVNGKLSYMLQKDLLLPNKYVIDNVALPLTINGMRKKEAREIASSHFKRFGLEGCEKKYPVQLSGGMRQRAALLRTYLCGNKVALLDEPFSALDTITRTSMQEWYLEVMEDIKMSTIFITHDIDEAILISDRIYIMKGSPASLTDEIVIKEKKPRTQDYTLTEEFLDYKRQIKKILSE